MYKFTFGEVVPVAPAMGCAATVKLSISYSSPNEFTPVLTPWLYKIIGWVAALGKAVKYVSELNNALDKVAVVAWLNTP
jgi:hypothetical protein